jgi:hypothetical protein
MPTPDFDTADIQQAKALFEDLGTESYQATMVTDGPSDLP